MIVPITHTGMRSRRGNSIHQFWRWALYFAALASAAISVTVRGQDGSGGVWKNPSNSVHIRAEPCGKQMCGVVVWANEKARADAREGGTSNLVGTQLFRDFQLEKPGVWRGKVFVPDIGKTFSGTITVLDRNHIQGRGCLVGNVGCRSQTWTRVER